MRQDDLDLLMHSSVAMVVMRRDLTEFWFNARARRFYPARFEERLIQALQTSPPFEQAIEAAMAQAGPMTVRIELLGEIVFGSLHRIDEDRLVLEAHPPESPASKLRGLQQSIQALGDAQRSDPAADQIKARDISAEIVDATGSSLSRIDAYLRAIWLTHDNQPRRLHQIVTEARSIVAEAMTELHDLADVALARAERSDRQTLNLADVVEDAVVARAGLAWSPGLTAAFADLPQVTGNRALASAVLGTVVQVFDQAATSFSAETRIEDERLVVQLRAVPQTLPRFDWDGIARKQRLAEQIAWTMQVERAEDGAVTVEISAPLAAEVAQASMAVTSS